jgi:hypothetical protein
MASRAREGAIVEVAPRLSAWWILVVVIFGNAIKSTVAVSDPCDPKSNGVARRGYQLRQEEYGINAATARSWFSSVYQAGP